MKITIDKKGLVSVYDQIIQQVICAIEVGSLEKGDRLQSVRALATELGISPNTIIKAYGELEHRGYISLEMGSGAFVIVTETAEKRIEASKAVSELTTFVSIMREKGWDKAKIRRALEAAFQKEEEDRI